MYCKTGNKYKTGFLLKSWQLHNLEQLRSQRPRPPKEKCAFPKQLAKGCWLLLGENGCKCSKNIIVIALVAHRLQQSTIVCVEDAILSTNTY